MTASAFNNYGMFNSQQFYNDPYFLQAFYSPNANQMYQGQQTATPQGNQQVSQALAGNPSFQGAQQAQPEKKSNAKAWLLLGGAALLAGSAWMISRGKAAGAEGMIKPL